MTGSKFVCVSISVVPINSADPKWQLDGSSVANVPRTQTHNIYYVCSESARTPQCFLVLVGESGSVLLCVYKSIYVCRCVNMFALMSQNSLQYIVY